MKMFQVLPSTVLFAALLFLAKDLPAETTGSQGGIQGKVVLKGPIPQMSDLKREADPFCAKTKIKDEEVIVGADSGLQNAVVRVIKGVAPAAASTPTEPVLINQDQCMYRPRVVGIVKGQKVLVRNSDPALHNVHGYTGTKTLFNRAQMKGSKDIEQTFDVGVHRLKCDVHPWMTAWVVVNENPFITVTGDDGTFNLKGLPDGTYTVEAWHERYGTKTEEAAVSGGAGKVEISFGP